MVGATGSTYAEYGGMKFTIVKLIKSVPDVLTSALPADYRDGYIMAIDGTPPVHKKLRVSLDGHFLTAYSMCYVNNLCYIAVSKKGAEVYERKYLRVELSVRLLLNGTEYETIDVGGGGIGFISDESDPYVKQNRIVSVACKLPNGFEINCRGIIVRNGALRFVDLNERDRDELIRSLYYLQFKAKILPFKDGQSQSRRNYGRGDLGARYSW